MPLHLRYAAVVLALCVSVFIFAPTPAQAIPMAGDYMFTSTFTGTFTSDGTMLTAWDFTCVLGTCSYSSNLSNTGDPPVTNDSTLFQQNDLETVKLDWVNTKS